MNMFVISVLSSKHVCHTFTVFPSGDDPVVTRCDKIVDLDLVFRFVSRLRNLLQKWISCEISLFKEDKKAPNMFNHLSRE